MCAKILKILQIVGRPPISITSLQKSASCRAQNPVNFGHDYGGLVRPSPPPPAEPSAQPWAHPLFSEPMDGGAKALHRLVRAVAKGERPRGSSS